MSDEIKNEAAEAKKENAAKKGDQAPQDVTSQDFFDEKAEEARESGHSQSIDLTTKIKVEFLKDFGFMKKGHKQEISQSAYDTYMMSKDKIVKAIR